MVFVTLATAVLGLGITAYIALASSKRKQLEARRSALHGAAQMLTHTEFVNDVSLGGRFEEHLVTATFFTPSSSDAAPWTEVRVQGVSTGIDLVMRDDNAVEKLLREKGAGVDVLVGDKEFDDALIIDGAPAEDICHVFADAELRATLIALRPFQLSIKNGDILLRKSDWLRVDALRMCVWSAFEVTKRATAAAKLLPASGLSAPVHVGNIAPYRANEQPGGAGMEMERLHDARVRRDRMTKRIGIAAMVLFVLGSAVVTLLK